MFRPVPMLKLEILVLEKHLDALTRALGRSGFVHLVPASAQSPGRLFQGVSRGEAIRQLEGSVQQCSDLLGVLRIEIKKLEIEKKRPGSLSHCVTESQTKIEAVARLVDAESAELKRLADEASRLRQADAFLAAHPALAQAPLCELRTPLHLFVLAGRLPAESNAAVYPAVADAGMGEASERGLKRRVTSEGMAGAATLLGEDVLLIREGLAPDGVASSGRLTGRQKDGALCVIVLGPAKARAAAEQELARCGFTADPIPEGLEGTGVEERVKLATRLAALERLSAERRARLVEIAGREGGALQEAFAVLHRELEIAKAQQQFGKSGGVFGVAGWLPAVKRTAAQTLAERVTDGTAVVAFTEPRDDELVRAGAEKVPVKFAGNRMLAPFQEMVTVYGVPRYGEIEPSPILAVGFLLMFGLMFGDVGQGAVLMLAGAWLLRGRKTQNSERRTQNAKTGLRTPDSGLRETVEPLNREPGTGSRGGGPSPAMRKAGWFLLTGGASAVLFGFLYGSVFGSEEVLPHLWLSPLHGVRTLFAVAVGLGVAYLSLGVILNIVNRFGERRWFEGVFDKSGVLGLVFYWGCLGLGVKAALAGGVTPAMFALVAGAPLLLLALKEPLRAAMEGRTQNAERRKFESAAVGSRRQLSADIESGGWKNGRTEETKNARGPQPANCNASDAGPRPATVEPLNREPGTPAREDRLTLFFGAGMEVFETVTGFLANTVSFVRVGAFALSHATLCMTVYVVGGLVRDLPGGGLWWLLVVILGNALVIALEGMIVTIQGLRLQYYEFFSRFFGGDGVAYKPFVLETEIPEPAK